MPLYMDFHKIPRITIDAAKKAHLADERIQKEYGVKYLQFWVNETAGNLFCLVEGPDKDTVETVHRLAHGHVACAVVEVDPAYYSLVMGENIRVDEGVAHHESGSVDPGYRFILVVSVHRKPDGRNSQGIEKQFGVREIAKHKGRVLKLTGDDSLIGIFDSATEALACARDIQSLMTGEKKKKTLSFRIGLCAGQPVTENNEFIEESMRLAKRLSQLAAEGSILVSTLFDELSTEAFRKGGKKIKSLTTADEAFLAEFFAIVDARLCHENFTIESLVKAVGISRPQLYRKIHGLADKAPNDLIRDLRLEKAWSLLKRRAGNISEVAFEVGFGNPSYFAKCFAKKFGCLPSRFVTLSQQ